MIHGYHIWLLIFVIFKILTPISYVLVILNIFVILPVIHEEILTGQAGLVEGNFN